MNGCAWQGRSTRTGEHDPGQIPGRFNGAGVAFGQHPGIRPFHQQMQLSGGRGRIGGASLRREPGQLTPEPSLVPGDHGAGFAVLGPDQLHRGVHEGAAASPLAALKAGHPVEDRQQAVSRRQPRARGQVRREGGPPFLVLALEGGRHQPGLGAEVHVQRRFRHPGLRDDGVHPAGRDAAFVKQPRGRVDEPVAGRCRRHRISLTDLLTCQLRLADLS
jgi:hypothetical protein